MFIVQNHETVVEVYTSSIMSYVFILQRQRLGISMN
jgi:hypothetical protein